MGKLAEEILERLQRFDSDRDAQPAGDELDEGKWARVVRGGKAQRKLMCPPGMKAQGGRCVKIKAAERLARQKGARKGVRAKKGRSRAGEKRRRALSLRKRKSAGLK